MESLKKVVMEFMYKVEECVFLKNMADTQLHEPEKQLELKTVWIIKFELVWIINGS